MMKVIRYTIVLLLMAGGLLACKKDKVPAPVEPTKWEKISGTYKVYDTIGGYLYEMQIVHIQGFNEYQFPTDSLQFINFDGEFNFTTSQNDNTQLPNYIRIGYHEDLLDTNLNRWKINNFTDAVYNNLVNDSIKLHFIRHNLNYYIEDVTPYYYCDCKQIAVKQH